MSEEIRKKTILATPQNFIDAKRYLRQCKIVIAARMHCAVNSIIEGTPALFLSYSQKSIGMSEFVYGNTNYALDIKDMTENLEKYVDEFLDDYESIKKIIDKRNQEISNYYDEYFRR